jgi:FkbM family methyltransferase
MTNEIQEITSYVKKELMTISATSDKVVVDVGANNEAEFSREFINNDYNVVLIEPQTSCYNNLVTKFGNHSNVTIVNKACSDKTETRNLYHGNNGDTQVSTLNANNDPWLDKVRSTSYEAVECDTLTNILDSLNVSGNIDILKIDAETWDPMIIRGLDFTKYQPKIVITEEYYWEPSNLVSKYVNLEDNGYVLMGFVGYNSIWKKRDEHTHYVNHILTEFIRQHKLNIDHPPPQLPMKGRWS